MLNIATALDPRLKMKYVSEEIKTSVKARLTQEMIGITPIMVIIYILDHVHNDIYTFLKWL